MMGILCRVRFILNETCFESFCLLDFVSCSFLNTILICLLLVISRTSFVYFELNFVYFYSSSFISCLPCVVQSGFALVVSIGGSASLLLCFQMLLLMSLGVNKCVGKFCAWRNTCQPELLSLILQLNCTTWFEIVDGLCHSLIIHCSNMQCSGFESVQDFEVRLFLQQMRITSHWRDQTMCMHIPYVLDDQFQDQC